MKIFECYIKDEDGKIVIEVPPEMKGKNLHVVLTDEEQNKVSKFQDLPVQERLRILESYKGTATYPDFSISKYDVYDQ